MEETKRCPFCDELIRTNAIKCKHCGSILTDVPNQTGVDLSSITKLAISSKYEIISEIGKGGMATVYKAIQKNLSKTVALKIIHPNLVHDQELVDRFHREAKIAAQLTHPNIIQIYDEGVENGIHFMAMEFLEGIDLQQRIKRNGALNFEEVVNILIPISNALAFTHSKGLVHRDVKSANIFLSNSGKPVLMDFGIAHANNATKLTISGTLLGTPEFMSFEQAEGKEIDHRSDIYSLGVVGYHALTARLPFVAENPLVIINKILNEKYDPIRNINSSVPLWLVNIIDNCLIKDRNQRIQNCTELETFLRKGGLINKPTYQQKSYLVQEHKTIKIENKEEFAKFVFDKSENKNLKTSQTKSVYPQYGSHKSKTNPLLIIAILIISVLLIVLVVNQSNNKVQANKYLKSEQTEKENEYNATIPVDNRKTTPEKSTNINNIEEPVKETRSVVSENAKPVVDELVLVPDLVGSTQSLAEKALKRKGLILGAVLSRTSAPENTGVVLSQKPDANSRVKKGTKINLFVGE